MRKVIFALAITIAGALISNAYHLQILTFIGIYTILGLGLNMLMGYAGQISLGHAAFYGLGAYTTGILSVHYRWSPWLTLPMALLLTGVFALFVAVFMVRFSGIYLCMGTIALGMIAYILFRAWSRYTGGDSGLVGIPSLSFGPIPLSLRTAYFYLVWSMVFLCFTICERIIGSRVGRAMRAIHDNELAASTMGIDTGRLKVWVFVLSGLFAGLAGFLYAHLVCYISPSSFDFLVSVRIVAMVVIGGMASIWGSLLGASLLTLLPEFLHFIVDYEMVFYGLTLMLVMIFLPQGIMRGLLDIYERSKSRCQKLSGSSQG